jgi:alpha-D-ribose 1-methylphosphonate 5-triphosphate synthase subunit PhnH
MTTPMMSPADAQQHATFTALMWALSYPGRRTYLPVAGFDALAAIAETLVDLETGFFTPDAALAARLARTGGRTMPPATAPYQFYPRFGLSELDMLTAAPVGSHANPDLGATIIIGCAFDAGTRLRLRGPGIADTCDVKIGNIPAALWELRTAAVHPPLGWDLLLVSGEMLLGLPRTTALEVI